MTADPPSVVQAVDDAFLFILGISAVLLVGITIVMITFVIRYSRKRHPKAAQIEGHTGLEIVWTVIPTILVLAMFYYGYHGFVLMRNVPKNAMHVKVIGRMWDWQFQYDNGKLTDQLYVPVNRPIKLSLTTLDVIHSFYLPAFRIKEDAVPGRTNYLWFKPQTTGPATVYCAEYCGQRHSYMLSQVNVMEADAFEAWLVTDLPAGPATTPEQAAALFETHDCLACHTLAEGADEAEGLALHGLYGQKRTVTRDGKNEEVVADETYLRRAIVEPGFELLEGHEDEMPPPEDLSETDLDAMVEYLRGPQ